MQIKAEKYKNQTIMDEETEFYGDLVFDYFLSLKGYFEGSIETNGVLVIEKSAEVKAGVKAGHLVVCGKLYGDVVVSKSLELVGTGEITGNVRSPSVFIESGTAINGFCEMLDNPSEMDIFSITAERLRDSLNLVE